MFNEVVANRCSTAYDSPGSTVSQCRGGGFPCLKILPGFWNSSSPVDGSIYAPSATRTSLWFFISTSSPSYYCADCHKIRQHGSAEYSYFILADSD
ncbi:hypothetical protein ARMSODRAFT_955101 [Armillaria solidipes]|uniref:Uncharacterized protein n=1 Tax=Armillaria solidipes TaxID=1076256 RepID=A0A2H3BK84_9AGAR|nr:hypothetical protein ARMSODRAFT_955101 [Armillaria solidipes]